MNEKTKKIKELFKELTLKNIKSFDVLIGGFANETYLFNDAYVLKIKKDYVQPFINYEQEYQILEALKDNKQVETCYYYDFENGIKISKFFHKAKPYKDELLPYQIISVAKFLKNLHKTKNVEELRRFDCLNRFKTYQKESKSSLDGRYVRKILNRIEDILKNEKMVLCHDDLVKGNLLFNVDKLYVIDFEMSGLNSIYFDLASFISENNLNDSQKELFLKSYFGSSLNNLKIKKVNTFIAFENLMWYFWAKMMENNEKTTTIYTDIAKEKLSHIKLDMTHKY